MFRAGDVDALVHLGVMHDPRARPAELYSWNITGTTKLLEYCQAYGVPKVVLLSSRERLRPASRQPAVPHRGRAAARGAALPADARPRRDRSPGLDVPVARARDRDRDPAPGPHRRRRSTTRRRTTCGSTRPPILLGFDPMVQLDPRTRTSPRRSRSRSRPAAAASTTSSAPARCRCRPSSTSSAASRDRSRTRWQSRSCRSRSALGISSFPVAELDFIRYVCMVDGRRAAAELGFRPRFGLRETIHAVDDPRLSPAATAAITRSAVARSHTGCSRPFTPGRGAPGPMYSLRSASIACPAACRVRSPALAIFRAFLSEILGEFPTDRARVSKR